VAAAVKQDNPTVPSSSSPPPSAPPDSRPHTRTEKLAQLRAEKQLAQSGERKLCGAARLTPPVRNIKNLRKTAMENNQNLETPNSELQKKNKKVIKTPIRQNIQRDK